MARSFPIMIAAALLAASAPGAMAATPGSQAIPTAPSDRAVAFATCLGRYSAAIDDGTLMGRHAVEARARRDLFADLLAAVSPAARGDGLGNADIIGYRIGARNEQARLMRIAQTEPDPRRARTAATVARRMIAMCDALV